MFAATLQVLCNRFGTCSLFGRLAGGMLGKCGLWKVCIGFGISLYMIGMFMLLTWIAAGHAC